jgi:hypothetical protein
MNEKPINLTIALLLVVYLLVLGVASTVSVAVNFPSEIDGNWQFAPDDDGRWSLLPLVRVRSLEQGLIMLAFLSGLAGSFLHAAQSLASYIGNDQFKRSWASWYFLRPWIGGILGFTIYFAFRAGLVSAPGGVNPFGVVALGALGGWFSKTTTDKLQEVFETLFKTEEDRNRKDKLQAGTTERVEIKVDRMTEEGTAESSRAVQHSHG